RDTDAHQGAGGVAQPVAVAGHRRSGGKGNEGGEQGMSLTDEFEDIERADKRLAGDLGYRAAQEDYRDAEEAWSLGYSCEYLDNRVSQLDGFEEFKAGFNERRNE